MLGLETEVMRGVLASEVGGGGGGGCSGSTGGVPTSPLLATMSGPRDPNTYPAPRMRNYVYHGAERRSGRKKKDDTSRRFSGAKESVCTRVYIIGHI